MIGYNKENIFIKKDKDENIFTKERDDVDAG